MIKPLRKGSEVSSKEKTNELLNTFLCFVIFLCCNYGLFFTIVMSSHAKRQIGMETSDSAFLLLNYFYCGLKPIRYLRKRCIMIGSEGVELTGTSGQLLSPTNALLFLTRLKGVIFDRILITIYQCFT